MQKTAPDAVVRRAAVAAALWQARDDRALHDTRADAAPAFTDDVCRLAARVDSLEIADVALVRAAAEGDDAVAALSRIVYASRQLWRAAVKDVSVWAPEGPREGNGAPRPGGHAREIVCAPDLDAAFTLVREAGIRRVRAPRRLLDGLGAAEGVRASIVMMLVAAYAHSVEPLLRALARFPFLIDAELLRLALGRSVGGANPRATLAGALGELPGARHREVALAALAVLDAARPAGGDDPSLETIVRDVASIVREAAAAADSTEVGAVADDASLASAAAEADRVWRQLAQPAPMELRVGAFAQATATSPIHPDLELIPDDGREPASARLEFAGGAAAAVRWEAFASALEAAAMPECGPDGLFVRVAQSVSGALTAYLQRVDAHGTPRIRAYQWPAPEVARIFTAPAMTFSASRLNAYVKCPRRWFFDYLCRVLDDPSSLHKTYGSVVHDALESLHRAIRVPSRHDPAIVLERLLAELDGAFGRARDDFASQLEYEVSRLRARRMAERYVRWLSAEAARQPMEIVHVELLQRLQRGGHDFVGYVDRVDRPLGGGPVTILDYKTGRIEGDPQEYLAKIRRGDEAQLALYYAMRRAGGDEVGRIALVGVRDPRDEVQILALDIATPGGSLGRAPAVEGMVRATCSSDDLETALDALVARCDMLRVQGRDHFPAGSDPPCGYCAYAHACRERPQDGERIFAR